MKRALLFGLCLFFVSIASVYAAELNCTGTITNITHGHGGELYITTSFRSDSIRLCSVEYEWQDAVGKSTCALWARNVSDALALGKQIRVKYADTTYTCATLPTWGNSIVPEYVRLNN